MDKKKIELIAAAVLVIIFVLLLLQAAGKGRAKGAAAPKISVSAKSEDALSLFPQKQERVKDAYGGEKLGWGRDPFSLETMAGEAGALHLMGITVIDAKHSKAIINNEIVSVGSKIGAYTVIKIQPNKVIVSDGQKECELIIQ